MSRTIVCAVTAALGLVLTAGAAQANVYDFSLSDGLDSAHGQLTTSGGASPDSVTNITGWVDGLQITGLSSYAGADQLLYSAAPYVDFSGVSFVDSANVAFNVYAWQGGAWLLKSTNDPVGYPQNGNPLISGALSAPEPGAWALMIVGLGLTGSMLRRRQKATARAA